MKDKIEQWIDRRKICQIVKSEKKLRKALDSEELDEILDYLPVHLEYYLSNRQTENDFRDNLPDEFTDKYSKKMFGATIHEILVRFQEAHKKEYILVDEIRILLIKDALDQAQAPMRCIYPDILEYVTNYNNLRKVQGDGKHNARAAKIKKVIAEGAFIKLHDFYNMNLAHYAAQTGDLKIVKLFTKLGVPLNPIEEKNTAPLVYAINNGSLELIKYMVSKGAKMSQTAFDFQNIYMISQANKIRNALYVSKKLGLNLDYEDNYEKYLITAIESGDLESARYLMGQKPEICFELKREMYKTESVKFLFGLTGYVENWEYGYTVKGEDARVAYKLANREQSYWQSFKETLGFEVRKFDLDEIEYLRYFSLRKKEVLTVWQRMGWYDKGKLKDLYEIKHKYLFFITGICKKIQPKDGGQEVGLYSLDSEILAKIFANVPLHHILPYFSRGDYFEEGLEVDERAELQIAGEEGANNNFQFDPYFVPMSEYL